MFLVSQEHCPACFVAAFRLLKILLKSRQAHFQEMFYLEFFLPRWTWGAVLIQFSSESKCVKYPLSFCGAVVVIGVGITGIQIDYASGFIGIASTN